MGAKKFAIICASVVIPVVSAVASLAGPEQHSRLGAQQRPSDALGFRLDAELAKTYYSAAEPIVARVVIANVSDTGKHLVMRGSPAWLIAGTAGEDHLETPVTLTRYGSYLQHGEPLRPRSGSHVSQSFPPGRRMIRYVTLNSVADLTMPDTYSLQVGVHISTEADTAKVWSRPLQFTVRSWGFDCTRRAELQFAPEEPSPEGVADLARLVGAEIEQLIRYAGAEAKERPWLSARRRLILYAGAETAAAVRPHARKELELIRQAIEAALVEEAQAKEPAPEPETQKEAPEPERAAAPRIPPE